MNSYEETYFKEYFFQKVRKIRIYYHAYFSI